jgi:hypothetical protein
MRIVALLSKGAGPEGNLVLEESLGCVPDLNIFSQALRRLGRHSAVQDEGEDDQR